MKRQKKKPPRQRDVQTIERYSFWNSLYGNTHSFLISRNAKNNKIYRCVCPVGAVLFPAEWILPKSHKTQTLLCSSHERKKTKFLFSFWVNASNVPTSNPTRSPHIVPFCTRIKTKTKSAHSELMLFPCIVY